MGQGSYQTTNPNQTPNADNFNCRSQTAGDKFRGRKGNSPDRQLRSQIHAKWKRMWRRIDSQEVGLEAATLQRKSNSSLVK